MPGAVQTARGYPTSHRPSSSGYGAPLGFQRPEAPPRLPTGAPGPANDNWNPRPPSGRPPGPPGPPQGPWRPPVPANDNIPARNIPGIPAGLGRLAATAARLNGYALMALAAYEMWKWVNSPQPGGAIFYEAGSGYDFSGFTTVCGTSGSGSLLYGGAGSGFCNPGNTFFSKTWADKMRPTSVGLNSWNLQASMLDPPLNDFGTAISGQVKWSGYINIFHVGTPTGDTLIPDTLPDSYTWETPAPVRLPYSLLPYRDNSATRSAGYGLRTRVATQVVPRVRVTYTPGGATVGRPPARPARPDLRTRENKFFMTLRTATGRIGAVFGLLTEFGDLVDAFWKAVPEDQRPGHWLHKKGGALFFKPEKMTMMEKAGWLYDNFGLVNMTEALKNIGINEISDRIIGQTASNASQAFGQASGRPIGITVGPAI